MGYEELMEKLRTLGGEEVDLIIRTRGDPAEHTTKLENMGFKIKRQFSLLKAVAVRGKAQDALNLWSEPWVESIEEDREVTILS